MQRRQFMRLAVTAGTLGALGGGALWLQAQRRDLPLTVEAALATLDRLAGQMLVSRGAWSPYRIFMHVAQSIHFSLEGFPEHKSALFQASAGRLAFNVFAYQGYMRHGLDQPIPGEPALAEQGDVQAALDHLRATLERFARHTGELQPHFAYGPLTHAEYTIAHTLHLNNHLEEIGVV